MEGERQLWTTTSHHAPTSAPGARAAATYADPVSSASRRAAFFDLDKTIIARSSALAFGRQFFAGGLINRSAVLKAAYAQLVFTLSGADDDQIDMLRRHITQMVTGWDVEQVRSIVAEALHEVVDPLVYDEATELIAQHREDGYDIVIVSASGAEVVEPIGAMLGADVVIATTIEVADGRYTGEIGFYAYGENKATAVRELATERGYDLAACHAYSDSVSDLPMLEAVGHPVAINPDRELRAIALERGWPVRRFAHGVSLRDRFERLAHPSAPVVAGTAVVSAAAIAGVALLGTRKRRARPERKA